MLDDAILVTMTEPPRTYRERQAEWWENEAHECRQLGMYDLAEKCLDTAASWAYGGTSVRWGDAG